MAPLWTKTFRCVSSEGTVGTAFLLDDTYALTAAHCVPESESVTAIDGQDTHYKVIWRGTFPKVDGALLKVERPVPIRLDTPDGTFRYGKLNNLHLVRDLKWSGFGFPLADPEAIGLDLDGTVAGIQRTRDYRRLQLTPKQISRDPKALKGASGGPVSINGIVVGVISRSPQQFDQSVLFATLLDDIFEEFFRDADALSSTEELKRHANALRQVIGPPLPIELDQCDRLINRYLDSLQKLDRAFHESAIRTPRCLSNALRSSALRDTYVPATLYPITRIQDFWEEIGSCSLGCNNPQPNTQRLLKFPDVLTNSFPENGRLQMLVTGDAGAGKSTLLAYLAVMGYFRPTDVGFDRPVLPLILKLSELAKLNIDGIFEFRDWLAAARARSLPFCVPMIEQSFFEHQMFDQFSERLGARWLILLDGLEDIRYDKRTDFQSALFHFIIDSSLDWVLTSRPIASLSDPVIDIFQSSGVKSYKIAPWADGELWQFATSILGEANGKKFLREFKNFVLEGSTSTPLLSMIGICVYQKGGDCLPRTKTKLYDLFVENALLWSRRRSGDDAPAWIRDLSPDTLVRLMAHLAGKSVDRPLDNDVADLEEFLVHLMRSADLTNSFNSRDRAREFIQFVAAGSGLIVIEMQDQKQLWQWWHLTVRDYLVAVLAVEGSFLEQKALLSHWNDSQWQEILIFTMTMLSDKHRDAPSDHPDVTWMFEELIDESSGQCGLLLYVALAEGAAVSRSTEQFIIGRLIDAAKLLGQHPECEEYSDDLARKGRSPIDLLRKLSDRPMAFEGLKSITEDSDILPWMRDKAEQACRTISLTPD